MLPPAMEIASGKFAVPNTPTGPTGRCIRRRSGCSGRARIVADVEIAPFAEMGSKQAQLAAGVRPIGFQPRRRPSGFGHSHVAQRRAAGLDVQGDRLKKFGALRARAPAKGFKRLCRRARRTVDFDSAACRKGHRRPMQRVGIEAGRAALPDPSNQMLTRATRCIGHGGSFPGPIVNRCGAQTTPQPPILPRTFHIPWAAVNLQSPAPPLAKRGTPLDHCTVIAPFCHPL